MRQNREQDKGEWGQMTQAQRELLHALLLAYELGDEAALSRLLVTLTLDEAGLLQAYRHLDAVEKAGTLGFVRGFNHPRANQGTAPGFLTPVGQVLAKRLHPGSTMMDGHGDKSRRIQALA